MPQTTPKDTQQAGTQHSQFRHLNMQIQWRLKACMQLAEQHFKRKFEMPVLNYRLRGQKAGVAYLQKNEIRLNRTLLLENTSDFIQQVVPHEAAHLIVYQQFGRVKPHGKEWQFVMKALFHLPAEIYHCFDLNSVTPQNIAYQCQCQIHHLSSHRHQKILNKTAVYLCKKCRSELKQI